MGARSAARGLLTIACVVAGALGCPRQATDSPDPGAGDGERPRDDDARRLDGDPRVDPARCTGDELELEALVGTGLCSVAVTDAVALAGPELLELSAPRKLAVGPGERLEFELVLHNHSDAPVHVDLRLRDFLPLGPESTTRVDGKDGPDTSCTLRAMSTEPPPERITLAPDAELAIPCEWYANTRLVDPQSYVGSECPDFPALAPGRYRSVFRISGGAGSQREVAVEIEVRKDRR